MCMWLAFGLVWSLLWLGLGRLATWYAVAQVTGPLASFSQSVRELAAGERWQASVRQCGG